jgi:hypothetical protein
VSSGKLEDDTVSQLEDAIGKFKEQFTPSEGEPLINEPTPTPLEEEGQESIRRHTHHDEGGQSDGAAAAQEAPAEGSTDSTPARNI